MADPNQYKIKTIVDMSDCGFVDAPVISTALYGDNHNIITKGAASGLREITADGFELTVHKDTIDYFSVSLAHDQHWALHWLAVGYVC